MALVKYENKKLTNSWSNRDKHATKHKIPSNVANPVIDYEKLRSLCAIEGLKNSKTDSGTTSESAHSQFMSNYRSVFVEPKKSLLPAYLVKKNKSSSQSLVSAQSQAVVVTETSTTHQAANQKPGDVAPPAENHDIRDHLPLLHKQRRSEDPRTVTADRVKTLRRLLRKLPFERTAADNDKIHSAVRHFSALAGQVPPSALKELCVVAQLDSWKDDDITVFGNTGLHMVLRGTVRPYNHPYMKHRGVQMDFPCPTPEPPLDMPTLGVGECFGTLEKVEGRDPNSRILTVTTLEPNCEFLKISASDYHRVTEQIRVREQTEKMNLMQACDTYRLWSKQPLLKMADLFTWSSFPANTVLASEGFEAPFIAIIKSGECHVMRQVEVLHSLPSGRKERRRKQVVMGTLAAGSSFGEVSVVGKEPMTCSVLTASTVELARVEQQQLQYLDEVTLQLLLQSSERTYANLTEADIQDEYIQQEKKRQWNEFKHRAVMGAINGTGIRPGYGKWTKK